MEGLGVSRRDMKKSVMEEMKNRQCPPGASPQKQIESLVDQAEFYTKFLLSRLENSEQGVEENQKFTRLSEQPSLLKGGELKYYQLIGLNWMASLYESGISGILADDMGLGKTIQTISMFAFLKQYKDISGPHIVIAPKVTLGNWIRQLEKWLPSFRSLKLQATKEQREIGLARMLQGHFDVMVTSYEGIRLAQSKLKKIKWHYLVIDEAHKIKNQSSIISKKVRALHNQCKLLLTGTPLQNNLHQLWSLMNFLIPEIFISSEPFDNWIANSDGETDDKDEAQRKNVEIISQLHKILKPFMLRRTKVEVQKQLPGKKEVHVFVGLSETQLKIYKNLLQNRNTSEDEKKYYLNLLMQLRKVCCHPYLFPNIEPSDAPPIGQHLVKASGKLIVLDGLLNKLSSQGEHKVLLFSQMTSVLDILQDYCHLRGYTFCRIDGSTEIKLRQSQIQEFNTTNQHFIFLLSTRAGGLGINLTAADTVVLYDSDFNPQMDLQAMDRAYRIGQKRFVRVYRLITENTIEEKIIERQMIKLKWDRLVIQQQRVTQKNKNISKDQMREMLQYGANTIFKATQSTLTDELIDQLLKKGQARTDALNEQLESQIKPPTDLANLNMDSINIFDFMQKDEQKKRIDAEAINKNAIEVQQIPIQYKGRRQKIKPLIKVDKKVNVPEYHFYQNKERLLQLQQQQQDYKNNKHIQGFIPLSPLEEMEKQQLLRTGFRHWNKTQFLAFISASERLGRNNIQEIAHSLGRPLEDVTNYSEVFWERVEELSQAEKILKFINNGQEKQQNQKHQYELLEWKYARCQTMEFNPLIYTKFKSKLFSAEADLYISQKFLEYGIKKTTKVKQDIRKESMFRFDHYLRSRSQADINKRMTSLFRLLDKEKQFDMFGLGDVEEEQHTKRRRPKPAKLVGTEGKYKATKRFKK